MLETKKSSHYLFMGVAFSILAIFFACVYHFNFIKTFDVFLALIYVVYFVGLAFIYNGAYLKEKARKSSKVLCNLIGFVLICVAVGFLIYGFITGRISLV